jgi:hypothetical protein
MQAGHGRGDHLFFGQHLAELHGCQSSHHPGLLLALVMGCFISSFYLLYLK